MRSSDWYLMPTGACATDKSIAPKQIVYVTCGTDKGHEVLLLSRSAPDGIEMNSSDEWEFRCYQEDRGHDKVASWAAPMNEIFEETFCFRFLDQMCARSVPCGLLRCHFCGGRLRYDKVETIPGMGKMRAQICNEPALPWASDKGSRWKHETDLMFIDSLKAKGQGR